MPHLCEPKALLRHGGYPKQRALAWLTSELVNFHDSLRCDALDSGIEQARHQHTFQGRCDFRKHVLTLFPRLLQAVHGEQADSAK